MDYIAMLRADLGGSPQDEIRAVAAEMEVNYFTLRKLVRGETVKPSYDTGEAIRNYYDRRLRRRTLKAPRPAPPADPPQPTLEGFEPCPPQPS